jgi:DNA-binding PadR family transcriptional regulator
MAPQERRRPYRLTPAGAEILRARLEGMEGIVRAGLSRLDRTPGSRTTTS